MIPTGTYRNSQSAEKDDATNVLSVSENENTLSEKPTAYRKATKRVGQVLTPNWERAEILSQMLHFEVLRTPKS